MMRERAKEAHMILRQTPFVTALALPLRPW